MSIYLKESIDKDKEKMVNCFYGTTLFFIDPL